MNLLSQQWAEFYTHYQTFHQWLRNMDTDMANLNPFVSNMATVQMQLIKLKVYTIISFMLIFLLYKETFPILLLKFLLLFFQIFFKSIYFNFSTYNSIYKYTCRRYRRSWWLTKGSWTLSNSSAINCRERREVVAMSTQLPYTRDWRVPRGDGTIFRNWLRSGESVSFPYPHSHTHKPASLYIPV